MGSVEGLPREWKMAKVVSAGEKRDSWKSQAGHFSQTIH